MRTLAIWISLTLALADAQAMEEITDFSSRINVLSDGTIEVRETIAVVAEGQQIKRGIYRDFPTLYRTPLWFRRKVTFDVVSAARNGQPEPFRVAPADNGARLYLGSPNNFLPNGPQVYEITYRSAGQLRLTPEEAELYWNVTGNGWIFPIRKSSATVILPDGAVAREVNVYTGPAGSNAKAAIAKSDGNRAYFETLAPLGAKEGLTVSVTWPPGFVTVPTTQEKLTALCAENRGVVAGIAGLLAAGAYFLLAWFLAGRDPRKGVVVPLYAPPGDLTPAEVRYLAELGKIDDKSFASALVGYAARKFVRLRKGVGGVYTVTLEDTSAGRGPEAIAVTSALFEKADTVVLEQSNYKRLQAAKAALFKSVNSRCRGTYLHKNTLLFVIGLILTLVPLGISLFDASQPGPAFFVFIFLAVWSGLLSALITQVGMSWTKIGAGRYWVFAWLLLALVFLAVWCALVGLVVWLSSPWVAVVYIAGFSMISLFNHLLKRPTPDGRKVMDDIEGFKRYLSVAEKDRLNLENPPERTPELFEKFLPYALALNVEQQWSEQFADVLAAAGQTPDDSAGLYSQPWSTPAAAAALGGSLVSAIASSSTAPGSSSGSDGGGSSGGGGGGGGGGGW